MFRSVRDGNKRSSVEQCPGTGGSGAPCTEAGDPAGRSRRPCRPCPRQVPLTNHPGTAAPTVAPREPGRTLGRDRHLPPGRPPSVGIPHRTALGRGHAGDVGVPRRAGTGIAPVSRTPRSHERPWAYTRLGPIHTSSRCPPTSSGSASAGCLSIRSTARWPQRGGDLPAVSVRRRCGTRGGGSAAPPEKQPGPRHAPRAWWDAGVSMETRGLLFPPAQQGEPGDAEAGQNHGARLGHGGWTGRSNGSCERFPLQRFPLQGEIFCSSQPQVS